jgi:hypothetical protein
LLPKLYGTLSPIWTPATFELGFWNGRSTTPAASAGRAASPGSAVRASFPTSRLVYTMLLAFEYAGSIPVK